MSLIKCPECGKDVSSFAKTCPNCAYPIKDLDTSNNESVNNSIPKDAGWVNKWKLKVNAIKIAFTFIFIAYAIVLTVLIVSLTNNDSASDSLIITTIIMCFLGAVVIGLWLGVLLSCKVKTREIDGYTILVYSCFTHKLVIEDEIQDSGRFLRGTLPNGKKIRATISAWDGAIDIKEE